MLLLLAASPTALVASDAARCRAASEIRSRAGPPAAERPHIALGAHAERCPSEVAEPKAVGVALAAHAAAARVDGLQRRDVRAAHAVDRFRYASAFRQPLLPRNNAQAFAHSIVKMSCLVLLDWLAYAPS